MAYFEYRYVVEDVRNNCRLIGKVFLKILSIIVSLITFHYRDLRLLSITISCFRACFRLLMYGLFLLFAQFHVIIVHINRCGANDRQYFINVHIQFLSDN